MGLGDTLMQEYQKLWNTVLTLSGDEDFGGPIPIRTTARLFLTQKETTPRGTDNVLTLISFRTERD